MAQARYVAQQGDAPDPWAVAERAATAEVRVEAQEAKRVSGKVLVRAQDEPRLEHADVIAQAYPGFVVSMAHPAADGTFSIGGLPEGTYTVAAAFHWGEVLDSRPVTVPAGAQDLVLDLPSREPSQVGRLRVAALTSPRRHPPGSGPGALHAPPQGSAAATRRGP